MRRLLSLFIVLLVAAAPLRACNINISANVTSICAGSQITFTGVITNASNATTFQWEKNGVAMTGTGNSGGLSSPGNGTFTYTAGGFSNGDVITCYITEPASSFTTTSSGITVSVNNQAPITSSFNGTSISSGNVIWFNSVVSVTGSQSYPMTIYYTNQTISSSGFSISAPDAELILDNTYSIATTTYNGTMWVTTAPPNQSGNYFLAGYGYTAPSTISGSPNITWNGTFLCSQAGVTLNWQWAAAVYTSFNSNLANLGVKASDCSSCSVYSNSDHAGTPESYKASVIGGARGGGGSNYTGSYSGTGSVTTCGAVTPSVIISGTSSICSGASVTFTATPTNGGSSPAYQWKKNGNNVGTNSATYTDASLANSDAITCVLTSSLTSAAPTTATSNTITETVNSNVTPSVSIAASPGSSICSGTSVTFTATPTNGGTPSYQWKKNGTNVGTNSTTYTDAALNNNDVITCVMTSTAACATTSTATSNGVTMTVTPTVTPSVSISGNSSICAGTSVTFTATPTNGGTPSYQWKKNGTTVGTNSATYTDAGLTNGNTITCVMTSTASCASTTTATSNTITEVVTSNVTPSVSIAASPGSSICSGTSVTFTATPTNGGTPSYQWKKNGTNVGTNSTTYTDASLNNNDAITCVMTSTASCATTTTAISNTITETVTNNVTPSVSISSNSSICAGTSVTFTATPTNGGTPSYQWKKNGTNVGTNSTTYTDAALNNNDTITCVMTSTAACATTTTATSNTITETVTNNVTPSVSIAASPGSSICSGTSVTFTATPTNGGTPSYQWKKNGTNVGTNSATYTDAALNNNDAITCVMTSTANCVTTTTATSGTITMTVTNNVTPSISISGNSSICAGTSVTFTATPTNGGTPSYQWKKNGSNVGTNSATYTDASLNNNDAITCIMTSTASCATTTTATSNTITETVTNNATPSVSIAANPGSAICAGTSVTFTATPTNGGTPSYQWKKNGSNAGTNSATYTDASLNNNDVITCVMTSTATCASTTTATSNAVTMTITNNVTPSVSISGNSSICAGASVTFTATPTNGGTPSYQWKKNGSNVGANAATYTDAGLTNGNTITCVITSTASCASTTTATSNTITETVTNNVTPSVSIAANPGSAICSGTSVTFTATPTNGGTPSYQWKKNGTNVGTNSATYTDVSLNNNDAIMCVMTSTAACATTTTATSSTITMNITNAVTPSVSITANPGNNICSGSPVTFTATPTNGGTPSYQWKKNGTNVGTNSNTYTDNGLNNNDVITCVMTSTASCASTTTVTSNAITMNVSNTTATQPGNFTVSSGTTYDGQTGVVYTVPNIPGTTYTWSYSGTGATINGTGNSVTVDFSTAATSGTLSVTATTGSCSSPSAARTIPVTVKPYLTWTCGTNNDWNTASNWDGGFVPYSTISVLVPANTSCQPNICSGSANVNNMTVNNGATVNICCPNSLTVNGDMTINGSILGCGEVIVPGSVCHVIYGNGRIDNFELNNSCGGIINAGDTLHIGDTYTPTLGVMTVNGELELLSDSTVTASILTHPGVCNTYIVGDVICDKFIHGGRRAFRFLGHPFSTSIPLSQLEYTVDITGQGGAANGFTTTVTDNPSAFWYNTLTGNGSTVDDSTGWIPFTSTNGVGANAWNAFEGIRLFMRGSKGQGLGCGVCVPDAITIKMHSTINECDQTVTLGVNNNVGFNFIANPYPSSIDLSKITTGSSIGANFNVWDPNQGLVGAYVEQPFNISYILPAYSAFFTTCNSNTGNTLTFHETDKTVAAPTGNLFKTTGMGNDIVQLRILSNNDSLSWDRVLLMFNDKALAGTDHADGAKLTNPDLSFYTFSADNDQLAIDQRPYVSGQVIKLGIVTDVNQTYSIRVDDYSVPTGGVIYLHDKYLNQVQQLQQGMHYSFTVTNDAASQGDNRFELNMSGTTGIANVSATTEMKVDMFPNPVTDNATVTFEAPQKGTTTLTITNLVGQQVYINQLGVQQSGKVNLSLNTLASGIYMVTLKCGDFSVTKRLAKQ